MKTLNFDADTLAYEFAEGVIGWMYPVPDRMLRCSERIVHEYLIQEMCGGKRPAGQFDLFAVEGGTAAMCYIFDSLVQNFLLHRGDTIALGVPTFTPYIEIAHLDRYHFKMVNIDAGKELRRQRDRTPGNTAMQRSTNWRTSASRPSSSSIRATRRPSP